ncbi:MAG: ParB/RepB/Spo0J family partition protein [bacterium]|jgi:hypothetical protein|nr:ParB/RepB/Spo0J family partition protein [bacterium]
MLSALKKTENFTPNTAELSISDLRISDKYQRLLDEHFVRKVVKEFNPGMVGAIIVSKRKDGYYIIDGQHRVEILRRVKIFTVLAVILYGLTPEQEAEYFVAYNRGRRNLSQYDMFKAELFAGVNSAVEIYDVVTSCGLYIGKSVANYQIGAISTLRDMHKTLTKDEFKRSLSLVKNAWKGNKDSFNNHIISGAGIVVKKCGKYFTDKDFQEKMSMVDVFELLLDGNSRVKSTANNLGHAECIIMAYNKGKRTKQIPVHALYE